MTELSPQDLAELRAAKQQLEHPSLAAKVSVALGAPLERAVAMLPRPLANVVSSATHKSLTAALRVALSTIDRSRSDAPALQRHQLAVAATGAAAGALGLPAIALELPLSTVVMLRSIAEVARSQGEDIDLPATKLACLEVFALGGRSPTDDATETGYFAVRAALAGAVQDALKHIAEKGAASKSTPALVRFITKIAARFELVVSQKAAAQLVPIVGAAGGAIVNVLFIDHYQTIAHGHFTVRRLERKYSPAVVRAAYAGL